MADRQYFPMSHVRNDPLPAGWEMRYDNTSGCPYFIDHNSKNTTWNDPRVSMSQYPYPNYRPAGSGGGAVEIPVRVEGWQDHHPQQQQQQYQQPNSSANTGNNYSHPHHGNTGFHHQPSGNPQNETGNQQGQTWPAPRRRGDMWEIPIQYVGQNSAPQQSNQGSPQAYPPPHQQAPPLVYPQCQPTADYGSIRQPGSSYADNHPRGPVTIPIIRESCVNPNPARASPNPMMGMQGSSRASPNPMSGMHGSPRASPNPMTGMQGSPRASPKPDFSQAIPQSARQAQFHNHHPQEPTPDYTDPQPGSTPLNPAQPIPAPPPPPHHEEQQQPSQQPPPPQEQKSPEERAFEIINSIMSDVKGLEELVNNFRGVKKDKDYRYIEEMLTRSLLKLDTVESGSNENVRQARKQAVRYIEAAIDLLELKAVAAETNYPPGTSSSSSPGSSEANSNNSTLSNKDSQLSKNGHTAGTSSGAPRGQEQPSRDVSRVKEMQLDSEIPC